MTPAFLRPAAALLFLSVAVPVLAQSSRSSGAGCTNSAFDVKFDHGALTSLKRPHDRANTEYVGGNRRFGDVTIRYRTGTNEWDFFRTTGLTESGVYSTNSRHSVYQVAYQVTNDDSTALAIILKYTFGADAITWDATVRNLSATPVEIGDLSFPMSIGARGGGGTNAAAGGTNAVAGGGGRGNAGPVVLKHGFVSGNGSFIFWMRSNLQGPYLMMTPTGATSLEYWDAGQTGGYTIYIHSKASGEFAAGEYGTTWRQPHTSLTLAPKGEKGSEQTYGLKFQWAGDYDGVRQVLVNEGKVDVQVEPGMTVPTDLPAEIALRSKKTINAVEAEFPDQTKVESLGRRGDSRIYKIQFARLGENRLKVLYGSGEHVYLEFFVTEPLETVIKKRGAFLAKSQHHDPGKWYNGLITEWNQETQVLLSPDNYDRITGFRIYDVTCDDAGLGRPAFLASKNAEFPMQSEVEVMDYYLKNFFWGGLQRTTNETYAYGVYGIPDWKTNRMSTNKGNGGQLHIWRAYDYPHVIVMYFGMYRIARDHPEIKTELSAKEYLLRAYGTAHAMFTIPLEIDRWSAYGTGFYNECVIPDLINELDAVDMKDEADILRDYWERKVRNFVNRDQNLFQSEYAFDSTGFESTHAIAKYAMLHADSEDQVGMGVSPANAQRFMEKQMQANLFCRGTIEPAYYLLGSDYRGSGGNSYTLTYMSQMGGWGVLDYGLNFAAKDAASYIRLGYASYLSAWALVNSGTAESDYGYWYPGKGNDGAAGGGFEPAPYGQTWLGQAHHRGSWYYGCEIDCGYCGALRAAATVVEDDPIFGRICLGGDLQKDKSSGNLEIVPKDGVRRRFYAELDGRKLHLELVNDHFRASQPIEVKPDLSRARFLVESDNPAEHIAHLQVFAPVAGHYIVEGLAGQVAALDLKAGQETTVDLRMGAGTDPKTFTLARVSKAR